MVSIAVTHPQWRRSPNMGFTLFLVPLVLWTRGINKNVSSVWGGTGSMSCVGTSVLVSVLMTVFCQY